MRKSSLLLAVCCGPCATVAVERLSPDYNVTLFFWGNNLHPAEEFEKRREAVLKLGKRTIIADYKPMQPESCEHCFAMRLRAASEYAHANGFEYFATSLTTSPHKDARLINKLGSDFPGYIPTDFKKDNGFARSVELSKQLGLYRQNYCGCARSQRTD